MAGNGKTKLHELLAVDTNLDNQAAKCRTELIATFTNKRHLFQEKRVTFTSNDEGATPVTEAQSDIQSTIAEELQWIGKIWGKAVDSGHQIEMGNMQARADVVLEDGTVLLTGVPATSLLQLEKRVAELHALLNAVPTLDPARGFKIDPDRKAGVYRAHDVLKARTKKVFAPVVMVPPTKEHPAQVEKLYEDRPVGTVQEQEWSSLVTPATKADLLARCEDLARAVKAARARANEQEIDVKGNKVADKMLGFVLGA